MMKALIPTLALLILNLANGAPTEKGESVYFEWQEENCVDSFMNALTDESGTKSNVSLWSKVVKDQKPSISFYYEHWSCVPGVSATQTYIDSYDRETSTSVVIGDRLKNGYVSSSFLGAIITTEYSLPDCDGNPQLLSSSYFEVDITIQATLVGTGAIYTAPEGPARAATATISVTAKDFPLVPVPAGAQKHGYMFKNSN